MFDILNDIPKTSHSKTKKKKTNYNKAELWNKIDSTFLTKNQVIKEKQLTDEKRQISNKEQRFTKEENQPTKEETTNEITNNRITLKSIDHTTYEYCEKCDSILAFSDEGFPTCTNTQCGILYKEMVDQTPEWRYYGADDNKACDPTRCGMPINPLLKESSYGCKIIGTKFTYEMRRIKRYTDWISMPYNEKSQYDDFQHITSLANDAGIPQIIIDTALHYYKKMAEYEKSYRGDNKDGIIAASIYIASIIHDYHRTAKELAVMFNLDISSATKGCKMAQQIINDLEKDMDQTDKTLFCKTTPKAFIERYCSKLNMNQKLTQWCYFIAVKIDKNNMMPGNTPQSIAAGIVYFASKICKLNISKKEVNLISDISEVTITKCSKKIEQFSEHLIPDVIKKTYCIK